MQRYSPSAVVFCAVALAGGLGRQAELASFTEVARSTASGFAGIALAQVARLSDRTEASHDPDVDRGMIEIVRDRGYPIEQHQVTTEDGYILTVFRIPYGRTHSGAAAGGPRQPVFVQHCLVCSSFEFVHGTPEHSLGYVLADAGFDVWLGNNRGNTYSLNHTSLQVESPEFWDFTYDQMAAYDLPAQLDYVLAATGRATVPYIGHSQGTMQAFAGFSRNQALADKVDLFVALAPVAYLHHMTSYAFRALAPSLHLIASLGSYEFLPAGTWLWRYVAIPGARLLPKTFGFLVSLFCGTTTHIDVNHLPVNLAHTPGGTSVRNVMHFQQGLAENRFGMYDFGPSGNLAKYGQTSPPAYRLADVDVKMALITGDNDILTSPQDVARLESELSPGLVVHRQHIPGFAHFDFTWGKDAGTMVHADIVQLLWRYAGTGRAAENVA